MNLSVPKKEVQEVSETTVTSTEDSVTKKCESEIRLPSVIGLYCFVLQTADTVNPLLRPPYKYAPLHDCQHFMSADPIWSIRVLEIGICL